MRRQAEVAGLPSEQEAEDEEAKRFDLLILNLQLAVLRAEPAFTRLRDQVKTIAGLLEEKASIPMVQQHLVLIEDLQTDDWWQDVTMEMLESVRKRLRLLVKLIGKNARKTIYTDFEDQLGSKHLTAAFIFGRIFSRFPVDVHQAQGTVWHGDAAAGQPPLDTRYWRGDPESAELILEIATATKATAHGVDALLNNDHGLKPHRLSFSPRSRLAQLDENGCRAAVEQIYSELESVCRRVSITTVRLFAAAPQTLMLQLGQRLQGAPVVQLYEWFDGRYLPSALVRSGVL